MLNIGMTELLIFGIIALLVLGPEKLPEAVRFVGKWYGKTKRTVSSIQNDFDRELRLTELRAEMQAELERIQELEAKMQAQMQSLEQPVISPDAKVNQKLDTAQSTHAVRYYPVETADHVLKQPTVRPTPDKPMTLASNDSNLKVAV